MNRMRKINILVINPLTSSVGNVVRDVLYGCWCAGKRIGGASVPPFPLIQLTTVLRKDGHNANFIDAQAEQLDLAAIARLIRNQDLLVCSTSTMSFTEDAEYLLALKQANPAIKTLVLGSHPTFMPQYALSHKGVDFIAMHEPEYIVRDLCRALSSEQDFRGIKGLGFRKADGAPHINPPYPFIENLDELPFPDVTLLPRGFDYFNPIVRRMPYMTVSTSRGCPGKCTFCTAPYFDGKRVRFQSAAYVTTLLTDLVRRGFREVYFRDDTFFVHKKRDQAICRFILDQRLDISWIANARVNLIDPATMALAHKAGCHTIKFGIESGCQEILDGIQKGYRIEKAIEVFDAANRIGLNTHAHVMLGNPGDTRETILQTLAFVNRLNPTTSTFGICTPYPGTPLFKKLAPQHPEIKDGSGSDLSRLHVEGLYNSYYCNLDAAALKRLVPFAYRKFYLRPFYLSRFIRDQLKSWEDIKRVAIAGTRVLDFIFRGA